MGTGANISCMSIYLFTREMQTFHFSEHRLHYISPMQWFNHRWVIWMGRELGTNPFVHSSFYLPPLHPMVITALASNTYILFKLLYWYNLKCTEFKAGWGDEDISHLLIQTIGHSCPVLHSAASTYNHCNWRNHRLFYIQIVHTTSELWLTLFLLEYSARLMLLWKTALLYEKQDPLIK